MTILVTQEKVTGDINGFRAPYHVHDDTLADMSASTAIAQAVAQFNTDFSLEATNYPYQRLAKHSYRVVVEYKPSKPKKLSIPGQGTATWRFQYSEGSQHYGRSLSTVAKYPTTAPQFGRLLNVRASDLDYEGYTAPAPTPTDVVELVLPTAQFTESYRNTIMALRGAVNNATIFGRPAGTVRFVMAQSTKRSDGDLVVTLGFDYRPHLINHTVDLSSGTVTIPQIDGHDYLWTFHVREVEDGDATTIPHLKPVQHYAYVERLFLRANLLPLLNIPGV